MGTARRKNKKPLDRVAEAMAARQHVDWDAERAALGESPILKNLARIQGVANVFESGRALRANPESVVAERPPPHFRWGPLDVFEKIGDGASSEIYRAYDPKLQHEVALKLFRPAMSSAECAQLALTEARNLARVDDPHVLRVYGVGVHDDRPGIWTELVKGETLAQRVARSGRVSEAEAVAYGKSLCQALAALHKHGILHCDIKPTNVMIAHDGGRVVLVDLGSASDASPSAPGHSVFGTPFTTAPEVLLNAAKPGPVTDLYGLGATLFWVIAGRYPVEANTREELERKYRDGERAHLVDERSDLSDSFMKVVEGAIDPEPGRRYGSVGEMYLALLRAQTQPRKPTILLAVATALVAATIVVLAALPRHLDVRAQLYRETPSGVAEALRDGDRIAAKDELYLSIRSSRPVHVWVVNEDNKKAVLAYPADMKLGSHLEARKEHRLPRAGNGQGGSWRVSAAAGMETYLVIASEGSVAELEAELSSLSNPPVDDGNVASNAGDHGMRGMRGIEVIVPKPDQPEVDQRGAVARLEQQCESLRDVWTWKVRLVNSGD